jgi:NADH dehydrogenase
VEDHPGVFVVGDLANISGPDGRAFPQLGSVALQAGVWAAENIVRDVDGEPMQPFAYHDKGIMAMIGHNAAIAEMGEHRHELHGAVGYAAWLGVHAYLMSGTRQRADAFISWAWDEFGKSRVLNTSDEARLHWVGEDPNA